MKLRAPAWPTYASHVRNLNTFRLLVSVKGASEILWPLGGCFYRAFCARFTFFLFVSVSTCNITPCLWFRVLLILHELVNLKGVLCVKQLIRDQTRSDSFTKLGVNAYVHVKTLQKLLLRTGDAICIANTGHEKVCDKCVWVVLCDVWCMCYVMYGVHVYVCICVCLWYIYV